MSVPARESGAGREERWTTYCVLSTAFALVFVTQVTPAALSSELVKEWQLESSEVGFVGSSWFLAFAIFQIPAGVIADVWGGRRASLVGVLGLGVSAAIFAAAPSYEIVVAARAISGAAGAFVAVSLFGAIARLFPHNLRATLLGGANAIGALGALLGTAPLAVAGERVGWRIPVGALAAGALVLAIAVALLVDDPPLAKRARVRIPQQLKAVLLEGGRELLQRRPYVIAALVLALCTGPFLSFQTLWAGPLMREVYGFSAAQAGLGLLLIAVGTILSYSMAGAVSDHVIKSRKPLFMSGAFLCTVLWTVTVAGLGGLPLGFVYMTMVGFGLAAGLVLVAAMVIFDLAPSAVVGTVAGVITSTIMLAASFWQLATGIVIQSIPGSAGFRWGLGLSLLATAAAAAISARLPETGRVQSSGCHRISSDP